jgi:uncharacterized coiled-coil protein SlyX
LTGLPGFVDYGGVEYANCHRRPIPPMKNPVEAFAERQTELETLVTHLQRTVQDLDEVIRRQQGTLDGLQARLGRLDADLGQLRDATTIERRPEDEKPPHY